MSARWPRPRALGRRLVALLLSWAVPASSAWAAAPPVVLTSGSAPALGLEVVPGLRAALGRAALEALHSDRSDDRDDEKGRDHKKDDGRGGDDRKDDRDDRRERDRDQRDDDRGSRNRRPILIRCECVEDEGDGSWTAHFGYDSQNAEAVTVRSGPDNQLSPAPGRRDQPTRFLPGRSRGWPASAYRLRFDGQPVTWTLKGPDGRIERATASLQLPRCGSNPPPCASPFWGPKRFEVKAARHDDDKKDKKKDQDDDRDWDDRDHHGHKHKRGQRCERDDDDDRHKHPTVYEETITLPPGIAPPYRLTVVNGGPGLKQRVLLGSIFVDQKLVAGPLLINPFVRQVTREVKLMASSRLKVRLVGLPGSFLTLSLCGGSAPPPLDTTPPTIGVAEPAAGALLAGKTPALRVTYGDPAGAGTPSGVDLATLVVTLDGQDRTAWFTAGPADATAEVPPDALLAEGSHRLEARIKDAAGNEGVATPVEFRVDSLPPVVAITQPTDGTFVSATSVDVTGTVADASPIIRLRVNGQDATLLGDSFTAPAVAIGDGPDVTLEAEAEDAAGHVGRALVHLRVDRRTPTVAITRPADGDTVQGPLLEVEGSVDDDGDVRVEVNGIPEDPPPSLSAPRGFRAQVPITDGTTALTATARDAAGNAGTALVTVRTDSVAPTVVIDTPAPGLVTKETSVHVEGRATDASGIATVTVDGQPVPVGSDGSFAAHVPLGGEGEQAIAVVATDNAGNAAPASVSVTVDRTPPTFAFASPAAGALLGTQPVLTQGTVEDPHLEAVTVDGVTATVTGLAWQALVAGLDDGPHAFAAVARDTAGNEATLTRSVTLDTGFPVVTITTPADGLLQRDGAVVVSGTVRDATLQWLRVNGRAAVVTGDPASPEGATFTLASLPLAENGNVVEATAEDALARQGSASVNVFRDSLPPAVELTAPGLLVRGRAEKAVASANDGSGSGVASVEFRIDEQPVATLGQPPFEIPLEAPAALASGASFTVSARATDLAGNLGAPASRTVAVVSEGVVVGQVLADETSLPLAGATVRLVGAAVAPTTTDTRGRYTLPVQSASALVVAEAEGRTSVERELPVAVGTGAVPVDARLTPLGQPVVVGSLGGAVPASFPRGSAGAVTLDIAIPAGALAADAGVRATPVSAQGLPGLLPLGWSPLLAFDLRTDGAAALGGPLAVAVTARDAKGAPAASFAGWPAASVVLAAYQPMLHAWLVVEANLTSTAGELAFSLPGAGAFALVVPDAGDPAPPEPIAGQALGGVPLAELPVTAASRAVVEPAVLPPSGGTAAGTLAVDSPLPLPSGTVVQARVTETFSLATGETASAEERPMDIVLFRAPCTSLAESGGISTACPDAGAAPIATSVPLTPSRTFGTADLLEGKVHLDILAGRESARGTTGGAAPVVVASGAARLSVAGMALARDTAIALREHEALSAFLPSGPGLEPVAEVSVDLSGSELLLAAELQVAASGADGTFVVARVERVDGIPRLAVVALAAMVGDKLVTQPSAILPGVRREGRHVFYRLAGPVGFVGGVTSTGAGGAKAVVTADGLPFIAASEPAGEYVLTTYPGAAVSVRARIPGTPLQAEGGPVAVLANEATSLPLLLSGASTTARVAPPNGSAGIAVNVRIEVTPTVPLDPASVATAVVSLVRASDGQLVPVRLVVGVGGRSLSVIPERQVAGEFVPLEFATAYTLTVSGLRDSYGTLVSVPPSTFTTAAFVAPTLDVHKLVFAAPDDDGIVKVTAPTGSFPPGTTILIVNSGNGVVLSLTADNDGAVNGELPASVDDRLLVTVADPQGNAKSFERSQYVIDPATGETAVGAGGGVVTSPDAPGFELRVPKDATGQAVSLRIRALLESDFAELPALPDAEFGAALEVEAPERPTFKKEVDLAFPLSSLPPLPADAKPEDAYYTVVREIKGAAGETFFQTIDEARVECPEGQATCDAADKKVVTASFPFGGFVTPFGALTAGFSLLALQTSHFLLMRHFNSAVPRVSPWGVITGRVVQPVPVAGQAGQYRYEGVAGCTIRREDVQSREAIAESLPATDGQDAGRFTLEDPRFQGGSVLLKATCGGRDYTTTAYVVPLAAITTIADEGVRRLLGTQRYETVGFANFTLPVASQPAPAPRVEIRIFEEDADGKRTALNGVSVAGAPIQVGVRAKGYVIRDVKIRGESKTILVPDPLKNTKPKDPLAFDAILQDPFTPATAGSYVIEAVAIDPAELVSVTGETVVQVLREAGGSTVSVPGRPGVIAARTVPRDGARGVSVTAFPALDFTEPVKNISAESLRLVPVGCAPPPASSTSTAPTCTDSSASEETPGDPVPLRILGLTPDRQSIELTGAEAQPPLVVSLTLQPLLSLSFGTTYRLELKDAIVDEDGELLVPFASRFSTFLPEEVGQSKESDPPTVTGLVILGERGYVLETLHAGGVAGPQQSSLVRVYDVTDPVEPRDLTDPATGSISRTIIAYPPRDIAGEEVKDDDGSPTGEKLIAIATAPRTFYQVQGSDPYWTELKSTPSNLFLYDVSEPDQPPRWVGAANLTNNVVDGTPNRLFMEKGHIYAATFPKGIQVIPVENLRAGFPTEGEPTGLELIDLNKKLTAGGLNAGAVVLTIPVKDPANGLAMPLNDLEAMDLQVWGVPRKVVAATGSRPQAALVLADGVSPYFDTACDPGATTPKPLWSGPLSKDGSSLEWGGAIALTKIADKPHALVGGTGVVAGSGSQTLLAIVDLTPVAPAVAGCGPRPSPTVVAIVPLPRLNGVGDILLIGNTAVVSGAQGTRIDGQVGGAALVDFTDPAGPAVTGYVTGVASRMAAREGFLFSTERAFVKGTASELGGVKTAALEHATFIKKAPAVMVDVDGKSIEPQPIRYKAIFPVDQVETAEVEILDQGVVRQRLEAALDGNGEGEVALPEGTSHSTLRARLVINRDKLDAVRPRATERLLRAGSFLVEPEGTSPIDLEADADPLVITATNEALQERLAEATQERKNIALPIFSWVVEGSGGATVDPPSEPLPVSGVYTTAFVPSTTAGAVHRIELRVGSRVLGRSAPIRVVPGKATQAQLEWPTAELPADGKSKKSVRIFDIKDRFGNVVPDGRTMTWEALPPLTGEPGDATNAVLAGTFKDLTTVIRNGETTNEYTAGIEPGWVRLSASADDELTKQFFIRHSPLRVDMLQLGPGPVPDRQRAFAIDVDSDGGRSPDGTPVGWGITAGMLDAQKTLTGNQAAALFTWPLDPRTQVIGVPYVFATVGRTRVGVDTGLGNALPATPGVFLELLGRMLLGDVSDGSGYELPGADGDTALSVSSEITVQAKGGDPGQRVNLTLDTYRNPAYLPVSHYTFDGTVADADLTTTEDLFGVAPARVGDGVTVDASNVAEGGASLHFTTVAGPPQGGVTVPADKAFTPSGSFGISGYLRLDSTADQTLVSKPGSYEVSVVDLAGEPRLEFSVVNGGVKKSVLSAEPLTTDTWYHFAGRLESNRLQLLVGDGGTVKVGDEASAPDATATPLEMGSAFEGHLDEIALFDLQRSPTVLFEDGRVSTTVDLNALGEAEIRFRSTGQFRNAPFGAVHRYGTNWVQIYEPPVLPADWVHELLQVDQALRQRYGTYVTNLLTLCGEGIADGESGGAVGAGCDLILGIGSAFTPAGAAVNVAQSGRDLVVSTKHYIEGKSNVANGVKAAASVLGVVGVGVVTAPIKRVARLGKRALDLIRGATTAAERVVLKEALEGVARHASGEGEAVSRLLEILGDETGRIAPKTKNTLRNLLLSAEDAGRMAVSLERLGTVYDYEELLRLLDNALGEIASNTALQGTLQRGLHSRLVSTLDEVARLGQAAGVIPRLSDDVVKGIAVLSAHGLNRQWRWNRVLKTWIDVGRLGPAKQAEAFENMMRWVAEGERAKIPGWSAFLAGGPGAGVFAWKTQGAYAVLEYLSKNLQWKNIVELERGVGRCIFRPWLGRCTYQRYIDIVAREADEFGNLREVFKEVKNLKAEASFSFASQVTFDVGGALNATARGADGLLDFKDLAARLGQIEYVLRGSPDEMAAVIRGLQAKIRQVLRAGGPAAEQLAPKVKVSPLSLPLPI